MLKEISIEKNKPIIISHICCNGNGIVFEFVNQKLVNKKNKFIPFFY